MTRGLLKRLSGTYEQKRALAITLLATRILRLRQFDNHKPCWQR